MKPLVSLGLALSVALNVVLGVLIARGPGSGGTHASETLGAASGNVITSAPEKTGTPPKIDPVFRAAIESGDLPGLVACLRAAGFPPDVLGAVVRAKLGEAYIARRRELDPGESTRPFWQSRPADPKLNAELSRVSREHAKILRDLLGDDGRDSMEAAALARRVEGVPPDKVGGVKRILQDYDDMRADIYRGGTLVPADWEKLAAIDKAQRMDLAQVLSPAELLEYGVRSGPIAEQLRWQLSAFAPTEAEFRTLYQLQAAFREQTGNVYGPLSAEQQRQRSEAQKQLNEQIKAALGPERAADYERAQDGNYRQTSRLVARLNLPAEATNQVWAVQQDIQKQRQALMANSALPADERTQLLTALAEEAATRISGTLGVRGFEAYKQYGGQWLQQLQPGPATGVTTTTTAPVVIFRP